MKLSQFNFKKISIVVLGWILTGFIYPPLVYAVRITDCAHILNPKLIRYVAFDQDYNLPGTAQFGKKFRQLTEAEKEIQVTGIPEELWTAITYHFGFRRKEEAKRFVRGTKVLSNNTWFVFDTRTGRSSFFKKSGSSSIADGVQRVLSVLEEPLSRLPVLFVPEHCEYGSVCRPPDFITESKYAVYSTHSIFSSGLIQKFAQAKGVSVPEWLRVEYVRKLAKLVADLNYGLGIYGIWHTQNLLIEVNEKTGNIIRFLIRDRRDMAFDPEIWFYRFETSKLHEMRNVNFLYDKNLFITRPDIGTITSSYLIWEGLHLAILDPQLVSSLQHEWGWTYANRVARIHEMDLDKSELVKFENAVYGGDLFPLHFFFNELDRQVRLKIRIPLAWNSVPRDQETFEKAFNGPHNWKYNTSVPRTFGQNILDRLTTERFLAFDGRVIWQVLLPAAGPWIREKMVIVTNPSMVEHLRQKVKHDHR